MPQNALYSNDMSSSIAASPRRRMLARRSPSGPDARPDLAVWLGAALFLGIVAVLSLPAARSASATLGWMPLWLVGMPLASLATRLLFCLPRRRAPDSSPASRRRWSGTDVVARRRAASAVRIRDRRAA